MGLGSIIFKEWRVTYSDILLYSTKRTITLHSLKIGMEKGKHILYRNNLRSSADPEVHQVAGVVINDKHYVYCP
jgi:hypothetical protein